MLWNVDVFGEMERLRREMDNLLSNYDRVDGSRTFPLLNVFDDKDNVIVTAELPGLTKDNVSITFADGILKLSGKQEPLEKSKKMTIVRKERSEGSFEKIVQIPTKVNHDEINASFSNGILTITLPKSDEVKPKTIFIDAK
jgi:HSP20 family protein